MGMQYGSDRNLNVDVVSLPALPAGANGIGSVTVTGPLPALVAGSAAIGTVGVTSLPALPAGSNAIGTVGVTSLPSLPAGTNTIGAVTISGTVTTTGGGGGTQPANTYPVAAAAAAAAVGGTRTGLLFGVLITTPGSAAMTLTDGSGGTVIAVVPANEPLGWLEFPQPVHFATSCYVNSGTGTPAVTVSTS